MKFLTFLLVLFSFPVFAGVKTTWSFKVSSSSSGQKELRPYELTISKLDNGSSVLIKGSTLIPISINSESKPTGRMGIYLQKTDLNFSNVEICVFDLVGADMSIPSSYANYFCSQHTLYPGQTPQRLAFSQGNEQIGIKAEYEVFLTLVKVESCDDSSTCYQ